MSIVHGRPSHLIFLEPFWGGMAVSGSAWLSCTRVTCSSQVSGCERFPITQGQSKPPHGSAARSIPAANLAGLPHRDTNPRERLNE